MANSNLALLQAYVGHSMSEGPAAVTRWLGGTLSQAEYGEASAEFEVRKDMTNGAKILHGGIMTTMIDEVMGLAFYTLGSDYFYPTLSINVDFLAPAQIGDKVFVKANVVKHGRTIINLESQVHNAEGKLLARATSNIARSNIKMK